jgi:putative MATE family efflux protein
MNVSENRENATAEASATVWTMIIEAVRGSVRNYTEGPVDRAILLLAIPMVLEMVMESIFAVADVFFVAKLGADAVATVGLTESMLTLIYAIAMGIGIGGMATVARRIGEEDRDGAARAAVQSIILGIALSVVIGVAGVTLAPTLLALMGGSPGVIEHGTTFMRVMFAGNVSIILLFVVNAIFRGAGDAAVAMRVLGLANLINILLGPCLIFGVGPFPELGVTGAAVATTIGRTVGALFALWLLFKPGGQVTVGSRHLRLDPDLMKRVVRLSASGAFQVFIGMASWVGLVRIISTFGSNAIAGYTIAIRVIMFALLPSFGMSNAAATMVGQALGAGKPERAERAVWRAGLFNLFFLGATGAAFVLLARPIAGIFTDDPTVLPFAADCLRIIACGFPLYAYGMVFTQSFNGAGDTSTPTIINLAIFWATEIPLAYLLAITFRLGPHGVFLAILAAFSLLAVVSGLVFRRGTWKTKRV